MIRALWLLLKIGFLIGLVLWIAERPGTITVNWLDYKLTMQVGFFLLIMLGVVIIGILVFSLIKAILDLPSTLRHYNSYRNRLKGQRALTLGLTAVAAGDVKTANYQAYRARTFLPKTEALPKLLEAQAARLKGDEAKAAKIFTELLDHKDAAFLGVRGLLQSALDSGDYKGALELGRRALKTHPHQGWILKIVYDLEIKLQYWNAATKTLMRAEKTGAISKDKALSDHVAILMARAEEVSLNKNEKEFRTFLTKAYKLDKRFVPVVSALARLKLAEGKRRAAVAMLTDAWKYQPHPDLAKLWAEAQPQARGNDSMTRVRWFEKLLLLNSESVEGLQAYANILMQEGLWGEARKHLEKAQAIRPNVNLYKLWAKLEERATRDEGAVKVWLEKAADAPRERVWICAETGRIYEVWHPVSDQGLFNTIIWDFPQGRMSSDYLLARSNQYSPMAFLTAS